ncbi:DUF418 domain-containing protein [Armatimonas rosea]|uniref:Putative membrane protein YeiB n=1 Tax=Armatimonas rosea TaxID=685828 RepID=A0A7W9SNQ5_ARMRO|nr:putative membrane protein YeiB [Armatimonas rosea]
MTRLPALDLARGIAVVGMIYMHFVGSKLATILEGRAAALFFILAGIAWALSGKSRARRALVLAAFGVLFHRLVWPTEVLVPLALMMLLCQGLWRRGPWAVGGALTLVLAVTPLAQARFSSLIVSDWLDDGSHLADHTLGWPTLRALVLDGNYPLLPWLALPLLGMLAVAGTGLTARRTRLWFFCALPLAALAQCLGPATWVPTTLPFLLRIGSTAAALIAGLLWWDAARGLPRFTLPLAALGRLSLTHYVGHIVLVFAPLRLLYPDEDWPLRVGLAAFLGYVAVAMPLSMLWLRRSPHGPLETLWRK